MIEVWRCKRCKSDYLASDNFNPEGYQCVVCSSVSSLVKTSEIPDLDDRSVEINADASMLEIAMAKAELNIGRSMKKAEEKFKKRLAVRLVLLLVALVLILCSLFFMDHGSVLVLVSICLIIVEGFLDVHWRKR